MGVDGMLKKLPGNFLKSEIVFFSMSRSLLTHVTKTDNQNE